MTPERRLELPPAPASVEDAAGHPAFGTYQGELPEVDLWRLARPYRLPRRIRLLKHKRWLYTLVATPEVLAAFAIVDLSYTASAFVVAVDLAEQRVLYDGSFMGLPGPLVRVGDRPGQGLSTRFRALGARLGCERGLGHERYRIDLDLRRVPLVRSGVGWHGTVTAGGSPALTVIAPVRDGGVVNVTQKRAGMLAGGSLAVGGRRYVLDGGLAGMDYTNGYLGRRTAWRWAFGLGRLPDGTPVGLNLVEGFNEAAESCENALWLGDRLVPLARASFHFDRRNPYDEWRLFTADGGLELRFRPIHVHREERDYKLVRSRFAQPLGTFEGVVRVDGRVLDVELSGVTEDQDILW